MKLRNSINRFGFIAIIFHWLIAVLIIVLLILGWTMVALPIGLQKLKLYGWHKELGFLVLGLSLLRLLWRLINVTPNLALPLWEKIAARMVHWIFYGLMLALPL